MPDPITKADKAWKAYQKKMADWKKKNPGQDPADAFDFKNKKEFMADFNSKNKKKPVKRLRDTPLISGRTGGKESDYHGKAGAKKRKAEGTFNPKTGKDTDPKKGRYGDAAMEAKWKNHYAKTKQGRDKAPYPQANTQEFPKVTKATIKNAKGGYKKRQ